MHAWLTSMRDSHGVLTGTTHTAGKTSVITNEIKNLWQLVWKQVAPDRRGQTGGWRVHAIRGTPKGDTFRLSKEPQTALITWEPINSKIITARFPTTRKRINLQVIKCYAPTNDTDEELKDKFYNQKLQARKDKDITLLMGNMNSKVGMIISTLSQECSAANSITAPVDGR